MSKISNWSPLTLDDFPEAPEELRELLERIFDKVNAPLIELTQALQGGLGDENGRNEFRIISVRHLAESKITLRKIKSPTKALIVFSSYYDFSHLKWERAGSEGVKVTVKFDTDPGRSVNVGILFSEGEETQESPDDV